MKDPDSFEGVITIARVLAKLNQTENSESISAEAIAVAPNDSAEVPLERAEMFAPVGKVEQAMDGLDEGMMKIGGIDKMAAIDLDVHLGR